MEVSPISSRQLSAAQVGIDGVDLTETDVYAGDVLTVDDDFMFTAIVDIAETGTPSQGAAKLTVEVMDEDKSTVLYSLDLLTGIDIQTNGDQNVVTFGQGVTAVNIGSASLSSDADKFAKIVQYIRFKLQATTASNGTTATGSVTLLFERP